MEIQLKAALQAMMAEGLEMPSLEESFARLLAINEQSANGKEALQAFLEEIGGDEFFEAGCQAYYHSTQQASSIQPLPGALRSLDQLRQQYKLALVSTGDPETQRNKMSLAGIPKQWFVSIIFISDYQKKQVYESFLHDYEPKDIVVCGDKYDSDLRPAKELGMAAIHIRWGRGRRFPPQAGDVDGIVDDLRDLDIFLGRLACKPSS